MATVNFSVPDDVKKKFNAAFAGENKSRVIADLMLEAVERQRLQKKRVRAIDALLALRKKAPVVRAAQARAARTSGRP